MGTETDKLEAVIVGLAVNQNEVGSNVTIPVIDPVSSQRMVETPPRQRCIRRQHVHHAHQEIVYSLPM